MWQSLAMVCQSLFLHSRELPLTCDHRSEGSCQRRKKVFASGMRRLEFPSTVAILVPATVAQVVTEAFGQSYLIWMSMRGVQVYKAPRGARVPQHLEL
jgi:hypothetical protein